MDIRLKLSFADSDPVCYLPARCHSEEGETLSLTAAADPHQVEEQEQSVRELLQWT